MQQEEQSRAGERADREESGEKTKIKLLINYNVSKNHAVILELGNM